MKTQEIERLIKIEKRIKEIAEESGLLTAEITFEITTAQRVLEGMSYGFPVNFSHWTFGRDFEKYRTIYEHTGTGIPYEQVWNFDKPKAFLVETNPFALNILVIAHVYGHVDFFLANRYLKHGRSFSNIAEEARNASRRFKEYEARYGQQEVERVIDAGMSIQWHQNPDPFFEEQDEEVVRERLMAFERAGLEIFKDVKSKFKKPETKQEIEKMEKKLERLSVKTPPEPTYDILDYIIKKSPKPLKPWMTDVLTVIRNQARSLAPNRKTKGLNEGWATYWHVKIMRRLFEEGLITPEEHGTFNDFHSGVTQENRAGFNWYRIYLALFENIKERWDKGQFGREYEEERNTFKHSRWDTAIGLGNQKIFEVRSFYSDRMAIEEFFTDEFIWEQQLYIWMSLTGANGDIVYVIAEDDPETIREILKNQFTYYGVPLVRVENGNHNSQNHLLLKHILNGYELDSKYMKATLEKTHYLWGKKIFLETRIDNKEVIATFDKKEDK